MYFAPPIDYDKVMKKIPYGKVITVGKIREYFAELNGADFTEPITAGIFVSIVAWASYQRLEDETPYWRTLKANGELNAKYPNGIEAQKEKLEAEEMCIRDSHWTSSTPFPRLLHNEIVLFGIHKNCVRSIIQRIPGMLTHKNILIPKMCIRDR